MSSRPQSLGALLGAVVKDLGLERRLDEARAIDAWREIAGEPIGAVTESVWMKGATLHVKVSSAAWRHELHLRRADWRARLNDYMGTNLVREIRFC